MKPMLHVLICIPTLFWLGLSSPRAQEHSAASAPATLHIPGALRAEHQQLHASLAAAIGAGGRTGEAARALEAQLAPHFKKEEQYAMPLLGLLPALSSGKRPDAPQDAIAMSERLKRELPLMLREHAAIAAAAQRLRAAALAEGRQDAVRFADTLASHARQEEQIHYPGAVLVGELLKSRP